MDYESNVKMNFPMSQLFVKIAIIIIIFHFHVSSHNPLLYVNIFSCTQALNDYVIMKLKFMWC